MDQNFEPTFTNIFSRLDPKGCYFEEAPFYCDYLWTVAQLFEFKLETILDLGCGNAVYGDYVKLKWHPTPDYLGIDLDEELVTSLGRKDVKQGDLLSFRSRKKFDLVMCHSVLQYVKDVDAAVDRLAALVKKSGFVSLAQTMTREDYDLYAKHENWHDKLAYNRPRSFYLRKLLRRFDIIGYGILVPKGRFQEDPYHVDKLFMTT